MKVEKTETTVYEVGDVVDVSEIDFIKRYNAEALQNAKWALIIEDDTTRHGTRRYRAVSDTGRVFTICEEEAKNAKYKGHVDLDLLFDEKGEEVEK